MSHTPIPFWRLARSAAKSTVTEEPNMTYTPAPLWSGPFSGRFRRRQFVRAAAGTAGGVFIASLPWPARARAGGDIVMPNPIPGGFTGDQLGCPGVTELFHLFIPSFPAEDEPSTITDFNGIHGDAHIQGFGTATNTMTGTQTRLFYDADIRFMKGVYIGVDGERHHGAFALV